MRHLLTCLVIACMLAACGGQKETATATTANSQDALAKAASMTAKQEKYDFLMNEAEGFMAAAKYEEAARVGEFIVEQVDPTSEPTRRLIKRAYDKSMSSSVGN